jgi:hypothetical protein
MSKEAAEIALIREQQRFYHTATNFLRWIRRTEQQRIDRQTGLERRVWEQITPSIRTVGGMARFSTK